MVFKDRLQYLAQFKKIDQIDFAREMDIDPSTVNRWWKGKVDPHPKSVRKIADYFGCNYEWLAKGKGEIWPSEGPKPWGKVHSQTDSSLDQIAELSDQLPQEIQAWMNDIEKEKPGFKIWLKFEFENRFPEFEEWKKREAGD